jgi:hypothetical protein
MVDLETIMASGWITRIAVEADTSRANKKATYDHDQIDQMGGGGAGEQIDKVFYWERMNKKPDRKRKRYDHDQIDQMGEGREI